MAHNTPINFQLALALALIKSKPDGIPVREHIENLRPFICGTHQADGSPQNYLDVTSYWRDKHRHSFEVIDELHNHISEQRFQVEQLQAELATLRQPLVREPEAVSPSNAGKKRVNESSQATANKKRKIVRAPIDLEVEEDVASLNQSIGQDARSLFARNLDLRRLIDENNAFAAVDLAYALQRATSTTSRLLVLAATEDYCRGNLIVDEATFRLLLLTVNNTFDALGRLVVHRTSPMQEMQNPLGVAIYSIANLFRSCLRALKDAVALDIKQSRTEDVPVQESSIAPRTAPQNSLGARSDTSALLIAYIKDVMKTILTSVVDLQTAKHRGKTTKIVAYRELYEGLQHILVTEAGKIMYALTFSCQRAESIEKELEVTDKTSITIKAAQAQHVKAANIVGRHLFPLLRHAITSLPAGGPSSGKKKAGLNAAQATVQRALTAQPLRRLQNTLIQGIFGVSEEDDLEDALRLPAEVVMQRRGRPVQTFGHEGGDWFIKSMWELCGWGFLAKVA